MEKTGKKNRRTSRKGQEIARSNPYRENKTQEGTGRRFQNTRTKIQIQFSTKDKRSAIYQDNKTGLEHTERVL